MNNHGQQAKQYNTPSLYQNLPNTLERPAPPMSSPTPSCMATLTGRMGAESNTCGHGIVSGGCTRRRGAERRTLRASAGEKLEPSPRWRHRSAGLGEEEEKKEKASSRWSK